MIGIIWSQMCVFSQECMHVSTKPQYCKSDLSDDFYQYLKIRFLLQTIEGHICSIPIP